MRLTHVCLAVLFHKLYAGQLFKFFFLLFINEKERQFTSATQNWALFRHLFLTGSRSLSLSVQFPTTVFVYIHRNQSSNHSTGNKGPIGKNKGPGSENVHSSEFEILALYIYIIVYNITRGYSVVLTYRCHTDVLRALQLQIGQKKIRLKLSKGPRTSENGISATS